MSPPLPSLGRVVWFRSRTGQYTVPAIVNCTTRTLNPKGVEAGNIPLLSEETAVHLTVITPGIPPAGVGSRTNAPDFLVPSRARIIARTAVDGPPLEVLLHQLGENLGGTYQEWDVPFWYPVGSEAARWELDQDDIQPAGTWAWPRLGVGR